MTSEGQDKEKLLFWECWVISLLSALTVLRNEITHDVQQPPPPILSVLGIVQTDHYSHQCMVDDEYCFVRGELPIKMIKCFSAFTHFTQVYYCTP